MAENEAGAMSFPYLWLGNALATPNVEQAGSPLGAHVKPKRHYGAPWGPHDSRSRNRITAAPQPSWLGGEERRGQVDFDESCRGTPRTRRGPC